MKKLISSLFATLMLVASLSASAQENRDVLLTTGGTLYTVETVMDKRDNTPGAPLQLTVQNGPTSATMPVPASLTNSVNVEPTLAYDSASNTLFLFWNSMRNGGLSSDLLFCSYRNGVFGPAQAIDGADWNMRSGLHVGITRQTEVADSSGWITLSEITVHAVWWQDNGGSEWARYAMLTTENGKVTNVDVRDLTSFTGSSAAVGRASNELLRHPAVIESASHNTVDIAFGDSDQNKLHQITLKPVAQGRLRIPIGVKDNPMPMPEVRFESSANVSAISAGNGSLLLYFTNGQAVNYLLYKGGAWSPLRSIALSDRLTVDAAVSALRRMVTSE